MAGQRLNRGSSRAKDFAMSVIDQAEQLVDPKLTRTISMGPHLVQLSFISPGWLTDLIAGAFIRSAEPKSGSQGADATRVYICQSGDGVVLPNLDWAHKWIAEGSVIPSQLSAPYRVFIDRNQGIIYCFNPEQNCAAIYLRNPRELDLRSFITPFRLLWSWIAIGSSSLVLHAAAVGVNGRGVLLSGPSGSGKSTLAVTAGLSGANAIVSDDCVLVHQGTIHAIYSRVKLEKRNLEAIGLKGDVKVHELRGAPNAKSFVQIDASFKGAIPKIEASVLVFPAIYGRAGFYQIPKKRSTSMLTSDSMRELFHGTPLARRGIDRLVAELPTYRLLLEESSHENIRNLESLVSHVTA